MLFGRRHGDLFCAAGIAVGLGSRQAPPVHSCICRMLGYLLTLSKNRPGLETLVLSNDPDPASLCPPALGPPGPALVVGRAESPRVLILESGNTPTGCLGQLGLLRQITVGWGI